MGRPAETRLLNRPTWWFVWHWLTCVFPSGQPNGAVRWHDVRDHHEPGVRGGVMRCGDCRALLCAYVTTSPAPEGGEAHHG